MPSRLQPAVKAQIVSLLKQRVVHSEIAKRTNTSVASVSRISRELSKSTVLATTPAAGIKEHEVLALRRLAGREPELMNMAKFDRDDAELLTRLATFLHDQDVSPNLLPPRGRAGLDSLGRMLKLLEVLLDSFDTETCPCGKVCARLRSMPTWRCPACGRRFDVP